MAQQRVRFRFLVFLLVLAVVGCALWFAQKKYAAQPELVSTGAHYGLAGQWLTASAPGGALLFDFKAEGDNLTGTVANEILGKWRIHEGRINGDQFTFKQIIKKADLLGGDLPGEDTKRDWTVTLTYSGKIKDGEIEFKRQAAGGPRGKGIGLDHETTFTAKRAPEGTTLQALDEEVLRQRGKAWLWLYNMDRRGKTRIGKLAPDFNLKVQNSNEWVRLSDFRGKMPVALVFGSYT